MTTLSLRHGPASEATLLPSRGGLLSRLVLPDGHGQPVPLLWLPPDFSESESGWPGGGAPLCFPFAGRVFHDGRPFHYALVGRGVLQMPIHGFAYALPWQVTEQDGASATLALAADRRTHDLYPFDFRLTARYELSAHALAITLTVTALGPTPTATAAAAAGDGRMPVALGAHPYFRVPLAAGSGTVRLETAARTKVRVTPVGGAGKSAPFPETPEERAGALGDRVFANLILADHAQPEATLVDADAKLALRLRWSEPLKYLVLWSQEGKGFHCVEPWAGLPDAVHNGVGVTWLAKGESLACRMEIRLQTTGG